MNGDVVTALIAAIAECEDEIEDMISEGLEDRGITLVWDDGEVDDLRCIEFEIRHITITSVENDQFQAVLDCHLVVEADAYYDDPGVFIYDHEEGGTIHDTTEGTAIADFFERINVQGTFEVSDPSQITIEPLSGPHQDMDFEVVPRY
jgi:hypothetical protein